jgi:hypothetical protein
MLLLLLLMLRLHVPCKLYLIDFVLILENRGQIGRWTLYYWYRGLSQVIPIDAIFYTQVATRKRMTIQRKKNQIPKRGGLQVRILALVPSVIEGGMDTTGLD